MGKVSEGLVVLPPMQGPFFSETRKSRWAGAAARGGGAGPISFRHISFKHGFPEHGAGGLEELNNLDLRTRRDNETRLKPSSRADDVCGW